MLAKFGTNILKQPVKRMEEGVLRLSRVFSSGRMDREIKKKVSWSSLRFLRFHPIVPHDRPRSNFIWPDLKVQTTSN